MNRFEEYFKNKINWKLFNMLLDAVLNWKMKLYGSVWISIINDKNITNSGKYLFIYRYYTVLGGALILQLKVFQG